jgi:hypothetical protein
MAGRALTDHNNGRSVMNPVEQKSKLSRQALYERQMELLEEFLKHGAISRQQYETSAEGLRTKMGIQCSKETEHDGTA